MLYKKYHRFYVRQFKKGVKFSYKTYRDVVEVEPYYRPYFDNGGIRITGNKYYLVLVHLDGTTNYNIKIEKHAI